MVNYERKNLENPESQTRKILRGGREIFHAAVAEPKCGEGPGPFGAMSGVLTEA
jgi:hypothetical protein